MKNNLFCFLFLLLVNLFYYVKNATASPVINGWPVEHNLFKFHVSIHKKHGPSNEYTYSCGGSIISERYILTVAHCLMTIENNVVREIFYPAGRTKVIAGTNDLNRQGIERDVIRVFIPLEYTLGSNIRADIAVAELNANLGVHQHPDRLVIIPLEVLEPLSNAGVNQQAIFCGFGYYLLAPNPNGQFYPEKYHSAINRYMNVRILGRDECPPFETIICVRNHEITRTSVFRTACVGDSGAGLVYRNKIVGVLSNGPPNCNTLEPTHFMRLNGYMRFIEDAQKPRGDHRNMYVLDEKPKSPDYSPSNEGSSSSSARGKKKGWWPFSEKNRHA